MGDGYAPEADAARADAIDPAAKAGNGVGARFAVTFVGLAERLRLTRRPTQGKRSRRAAAARDGGALGGRLGEKQRATRALAHPLLPCPSPVARRRGEQRPERGEKHLPAQPWSPCSPSWSPHPLAYFKTHTGEINPREQEARGNLFLQVKSNHEARYEEPLLLLLRCRRSTRGPQPASPPSRIFPRRREGRNRPDYRSDRITGRGLWRRSSSCLAAGRREGHSPRRPFPQSSCCGEKAATLQTTGQREGNNLMPPPSPVFPEV